MDKGKKRICKLILYEYRKGSNASEGAQNICQIEGNSLIGRHAGWYRKFRSGDMSL